MVFLARLVADEAKMQYQNQHQVCIPHFFSTRNPYCWRLMLDSSNALLLPSRLRVTSYLLKILKINRFLMQQTTVFLFLLGYQPPPFYKNHHATP